MKKKPVIKLSDVVRALVERGVTDPAKIAEVTGKNQQQIEELIKRS